MDTGDDRWSTPAPRWTGCRRRRGREGPLVLMCAEGYPSSLAAAPLMDLGLANATDMEGGFARWRAEGLPVVGAPRRGVASRNGAGIEPTGRE
jgi:rhodanese-related sulfurtransferase